MKTIVDIHNHLNLLPKILGKLTDLAYKNKNDPDFLINTAHKNNTRLIISVALYASPILSSGMSQIESQINFVKMFISKHPNAILIQTKEDLKKEFNIGFVFHLESARWLDGDQSKLTRLNDLGVRGIIPVHFLTNWFGASGEDPRAGHGLSPEGQKFLDKMHELKMWMDISHMDDQTANDALKYFQGQVMASHIGLQKFKPAKRNLNEQNARLLFEKNGLMGLIAWSHLMGNTKDSFKEQIDFLIKNNFTCNLAIGTDLGAPIKTPSFIKSIFDYQSFLKSEYQEHCEGIISRNALNFLEESLPS